VAVDTSPDVARGRAEKESAAKLKKTEARRKSEAEHLESLKEWLGEVGKDNGQWVVGTDQNDRLILFENIYDDKGNYAGQKEIFFWVQPDGTTFSKLYQSGIIKRVKETFKGNLDALRQQLFDKNYLSETDYTTKDETAFNNAIVKAARNYSLTEVQKYTVEGQTKFNPFGKWLSGLGSVGGDLPVQDINLMDRDVVEAIVRDVYRGETDMSPDEVDAFIQQKTDMYMDQIKKGTFTTTEKVGGKIVRKQTKPFTEAQVRAELPGMIQSELPGATDMKKSFDFLAFLDSLGAPVV
jgi:hypothetical protein